MSIGLVQDSLSHQPIGMYGIVKTLVGYFAASVSMRFDVQNPVVTFILSFLLLLLPSVLLLGAGARVVGRDHHLRCTANLDFWALERGGGAAAVPHFR